MGQSLDRQDTKTGYDTQPASLSTGTPHAAFQGAGGYSWTPWAAGQNDARATDAGPAGPAGEAAQASAGAAVS